MAGTISPTEKTQLKAIRAARTRVPAATFTMNNPAPSKSYVDYAVNQVLQPGGEKYWSEVAGADKQTAQAVREGLAEKGIPLEQLSASSRQLGETATTIVPKIRKVITQLNDPKLRAKLGPVMGRWNEFMAGKVGTADPQIAALRDTVSLLQTGAMRAHVGARGGGQLIKKFEGMFNSDKMDAPTLQASLGATADFLQGYADELKRDTSSGGASNGPPPGATGKVPGSDGKMYYHDANNKILGVVQ